MPSCRTIAASGLLCARALSASDARAETDRFWQYDVLVDRYCQGHRAESVQDLGTWPAGDVKAVVFQAVRREWAKFPAAILLHTDRALQEHANAASSAYDVHISAALTLMKALPRTRQGQRFGARWFLATGLLHAEVGGALAWLNAGLKPYPDDPGLLLARGSFQESFFAFGNDNTDSARRARAESDFRHALKVDEGLHEARLRLAHVLMSKGDDAGAAQELDVVLRDAREPDLLYLARLFQGRIREHQGRWGEAVEAYAAAVAVDERGQTARLALSQARWRLGDAVGAAAALQPIVAQAAPASGYMDPWWLYPWAQRARADAMLEDLRKEVSS